MARIQVRYLLLFSFNWSYRKTYYLTLIELADYKFSRIYKKKDRRVASLLGDIKECEVFAIQIVIILYPEGKSRQVLICRKSAFACNVQKIMRPVTLGDLFTNDCAVFRFFRFQTDV